jgi:hypothetical protein
MDVMIFDPLERFFTSISVIIMMLCGLIYIFFSKKKESSDENKILLGFGIYWLTVAISTFLAFYSDYFIEGNFMGFTYYGDYSNLSLGFLVTNHYSKFSWLIGITILIYTFERYIKSTKYLLTISNIALIPFTFIIPYEIIEMPMYMFIVTDAILIAATLIWFSLKSDQEFQFILVFILIAMLLFAVGESLDNKEFIEMNLFPLYLPSLLKVLSLFITIFPTLLNPKKFSRSLIWWSVFFVFCISYLVFGFVFIFLSRDLIPIFNVFFIGGQVIMIPLTVYTGKQLTRNLRTKEIPREFVKKRKKFKDSLGMFSKPEKITEQEISVAIEKKICLVCKGAGLRYTYICPKCNVIYCVKCAKTLEKMENACWVCNNPFDESKPVMLEEKLEEDLVVEKGVLKGKK